MDRLRYPIAVLMTVAAVIFALYVLSPILDPGYSAGGDDPVHISYDLELKKILDEEGKAFGWSYLYGTGAPIFIFRPPGFYLASVLLHAGSGGTIPLETGHKALYLLALALFPVAVFYLMRRFDFPPLACGIAALFSLGPVSSWGHTIDAYFDLGLAKQALALLFVPFTLGKAHGVMRRGDAVFTGSVLFGLTFLNHPYMAMSIAWLVGLYLVLHFFSFPLRETVRAAVRAAAMMGTGLLLIAFWLVPFYSSPEIHPTTGYLSQSRHGFSVMTDTAAGVLDHFFDGSLFDSPNPEPFGAGSVWSWRDNSGSGRWPALTWACLIGLVFLFAGFRRFGNFFFLCGFVFSLLVFMGPDDLPVLRSIPFQEQFQYIHWIPVPELFCVCSAGYGLYSLAVLVGTGARFLGGGRERWAAVAFGISGAVLIAVFVFPVWRDRLQWGARKVRTRDFETIGGVQTPYSLRSAANLEFQRCLDLLQAAPPFSRFYASPTSIRSGQEIFYFTVAPALSGRTDVISPLFSGLMGGWNRIVGSTIRHDLWNSRNLIDLLDIHLMIAHRDNLGKFEPEPEFMETAFSGNIWVAREIIDPPGAFGFTGSRPVLAYVGYRDWERTMESWIRYFRDLPRPERAAYVLRAPTGASPGEVQGIPLREFSALLVAGGDAWTASAARDLLARAGAAGLEIFALAPIPGAPVEVTVADPDGIPFARFEEAPVAWNRERVEEERERHRVAFDCAGPGWLYLKTAYYRGWRALAAGRPAPVFCLSPGYNAVKVKAGASDLVFTYAGANRAGVGYLVSGLTLAGGMVSLLRRRRRKFPRNDRGRRPLLMLLPFFFLVGFLIRLYWLESGLKIPIPVKPLAGAVTDTSLFLYWNPVPGEAVRYDVQVDGTSDRFQNLLYEWKGTSENKLKIREAFPPGAALWWRVRSVRGDKTGPWSRAIPFRTAGSPPSPPPAPSLEITDIEPSAAELEVAVRAPLPDGTVVYLQAVDPVDRASLYRLRARIDRGGFRQRFPLPAGYEGKKLSVSVSTWADQFYPVTETLGERGEALARCPPRAGKVLPALRVSAGLSREASSAASVSARRRFSDYYLSLNVRKEGEEIVLFGGTNLPEGALLTVVLARVPNGPPAFSNAVPVKSGRFFARLQVRSGEPPLGEADWKAEVVFDPRFPSSNEPPTDFDRLPASGEDTVFTIGDERLFDPGGEDLTATRADDVN